MDPNILLADAPSIVKVGGASIPINASHRTGIQAMRLTDDPSVGDADKTKALLFVYFGRIDQNSGHIRLPKEVSKSPERSAEAALSFFNFNEPRPPERPGNKLAEGTRIFDWDCDAGKVLADFQREYGIDLSDASLAMHWWRFWSLFKGLSDTSQTMEAIKVRGTVPNEKKMGKEAVEQLMERKAALMLPARTEEEAMQLTNLRYRWALNV